MNDPPVITLPPAGGCLGEWHGWYLRTACSCGTTIRAVESLSERDGVPLWMPMPAVVAWMRCRRCRERPRDAVLMNHSRVGARGMPHNEAGLLVPVPSLEDMLRRAGSAPHDEAARCR